MSDNKIINLDEQKDLQLEMLKELKKICDDNNITYFLGGGTLLGAIRHKGYIPWDDDIDVMMPRKDYEELLEIFNKKCNKKYKMLTYENTDGYYYSFAKIVNLETKLIEKGYRKIEEMGLYIDVFPIDFLPDNKRKTKHIFNKYKFLNRCILIYIYNNIEEYKKSKFKLLLRKMFIRIIEKNKRYKKILKRMDSLANKYTNTNTVACICGRYSEKEIMPSTYISNYELADFEDDKYKVPIGYKDYLTKHYGNYMELPPKEKRTKEHSNFAYWN